MWIEQAKMLKKAIEYQKSQEERPPNNNLKEAKNKKVINKNYENQGK